MVHTPYIDSHDFISLEASAPLNLTPKSVSHDSATMGRTKISKWHYQILLSIQKKVGSISFICVEDQHGGKTYSLHYQQFGK